MVKGITRRVIVVKPENKLFDEAIFIVRDDADAESGVTKDDVVAEAARAAREFVKTGHGIKRGKPRSGRNAFWAGLGAFTASLFWVVYMFIR